MTARDNGGPAFPNIARDMMEGEKWRWIDGMSLRDWFAGQALQWAGSNEWFHADERHVAERAYKMADAMVAERAKAEGGAA
jgi:hypothetical protein